MLYIYIYIVSFLFHPLPTCSCLVGCHHSQNKVKGYALAGYVAGPTSPYPGSAHFLKRTSSLNHLSSFELEPSFFSLFNLFFLTLSPSNLRSEKEMKAVLTLKRRGAAGWSQLQLEHLEEPLTASLLGDVAGCWLSRWVVPGAVFLRTWDANLWDDDGTRAKLQGEMSKCPNPPSSCQLDSQPGN